MQPHSPQLPTDHPTAPAPKSLKKGALYLVIVVAVVAVLIAFLLPKKQAEASQTPTTSTLPTASGAPGGPQRRTQAYKDPVQ